MRVGANRAGLKAFYHLLYAYGTYEVRFFYEVFLEGLGVLIHSKYGHHLTNLEGVYGVAIIAFRISIYLILHISKTATVVVSVMYHL